MDVANIKSEAIPLTGNAMVNSHLGLTVMSEGEIHLKVPKINSRSLQPVNSNNLTFNTQTKMNYFFKFYK